MSNKTIDCLNREEDSCHRVNHFAYFTHHIVWRTVAGKGRSVLFSPMRLAVARQAYAIPSGKAPSGEGAFPTSCGRIKQNAKS